MGPSEAKLKQIADSAKGGVMSSAGADWRTARTGLEEVVRLLDALNADVQAAWPDAAGEAAAKSLDVLSRDVEKRAQTMLWAEESLETARAAVAAAKADINAVEAMPIPAAPTAPSAPPADASPERQTTYRNNQNKYEAAVSDRQAALDAREARAAQAVETYDSKMVLAAGQLHDATPEAKDRYWDTGSSSTGTTSGSMPQSYGYSSGGSGTSFSPTHAGLTAAAVAGAGGAYGGVKAAGYGTQSTGAVKGSGSSLNGDSSGLPDGAIPAADAGGSSMAGLGGIGAGVAGALGVAGAAASGRSVLGGTRAAAGAGGTGARPAATSGVLGKAGSTSPGMAPGSSAGTAPGSTAGGRSATTGRYGVPGTSATVPGSSSSGAAGSRGAAGMGAGARATGANGAGAARSGMPGAGVAGGRAATGNDDEQNERRSAFEVENEWLDDEEAGHGVLD